MAASTTETTTERVRTGLLPAPGIDHERAVEYAARAGLDHLEIYAEGEPWRGGALADPAALRARLAEHGLDLTAHLPFPIDLASPMDPVREGGFTALEGYLEALAERGAERAVLHLSAPSRRAADEPEATVRDRLVDSAARAAALGAEHGVEVCAENLPGGLMTMTEFPRLFAETEVSMTLDTGHAILNGHSEAEVASFLETHGDRVSHVHLNDNRAGVEEWRDADEHLPFGAGTIDFETMLAPAIEGRWTPTMTMEIVCWDEGYLRTSADRLHGLLGR